MSILFREKRSFPSANDVLAAASRFRGEDSGGGYVYSTTEAMQIAAVVACVGLRAGAFAQIPLKGYRQRDGLHELLPSQPSLLVRPSPTVVPSVWKTQMSVSRDIWGFAVGRILGVDAAGYPSMAEWLPPSETHAWQDYMSGPLRWKVGQDEVDASLLLHVPSRWVMPGNPLGISPLERSGLVDLAKRAQDFGRDWFRNGAVPSSIIYSEQELTGKQAEDIVSAVTSKWRSRKPAVLDSRLKYEQVSVGANESQFLETQRQVAADIAVSFNLPPEKINAVVSGQSVTYANREQNVQQYLMDSINPDLVVIQEVFEQFLPRGQFPRWATGAFLRSDLKTRYESYKVGLEAGFLEVDEVRAWEEMKPLGGGEDDQAD